VSVPLLDLKAQHATIRDQVMAKVAEVVEAQTFILGQPVADLEDRIAALSHARFGVGVASGTDALLLPLKALDLRPGDEVITSPFTFFASAGTIHNAGARPVFVDVDPDTWNIDPAAVEAAITPRTRAIMPVHLFGQLAALERLLPLAQRHGLAVIEDACQAIGARRRMDGTWRTAGELGTVAAFSFFPSKNLGGWGDAGMVVTSDEALAVVKAAVQKGVIAMRAGLFTNGIRFLPPLVITDDQLREGLDVTEQALTEVETALLPAVPVETVGSRD